MIRGALLSRFYLEDGTRDSDAYRTLTDARAQHFAAEARRLWHDLASMPRPREAETEDEFIFPVLDRLGWHT